MSSTKVCGSRDQPAWIQLCGVLLAAILPPSRGGDPTFPPPARNTWVRSYLPWPSRSPRYGSCLQNKASLKEETSLRRSGVEVEEPARTFRSSAPRSPARSFSRTFLAPDARNLPSGRDGADLSRHLPQHPAARVLGRGEVLRHTCAGLRTPRSVPGCAPERSEAPYKTCPLSPLSGDGDPRPSRCSCEPAAPCEGGGAFQCSAAAPSRFVIRQKAADCCNRYFSLKKLRSNLGEPFSMNTFTPERSLFSAST